MREEMNDKTLCPLCGEGHLTPRTEETVTEYAGQQGKVTLRLAECDACGSEVAGEADSRANKRAVLAFRKSIDGLLTGAEIRALREKYGITQDQAARLFGGGPKAFSTYEADDVAHSAAMDTLLRLALRSEEAFWELVALKGMAAELPVRKTAQRHQMTVPTIHVVLTLRHEGVPELHPIQTRQCLAPSGAVSTLRH
jgi:HTH-type transcriptional regulator/antitoxin MqsA